MPKVGRCRRRGIPGAWNGTIAVSSAHFRHADWSMFGLMNTLQLQFLMLIFAGWGNRGQQDVIEDLLDLEAAELPSKPGTPRAAGSKAPAVHRSSTSSSRSQGQGDWPKRALRDQHLGDAGHLTSVVSQADREEVRWQPEPHGRSTEDSRRDREADLADGPAEFDPAASKHI